MNQTEHKDVPKSRPRLSKYQVEIARNVNILLVGKTTSGKTTLMKVLENEWYKPPTGKLVSGTRAATLTPLTITLPDGKKVCLNVIDTPGLFEKRQKLDDTRTNHVLLEIAQTCLSREITKIHVLCIVAAANSGLLRDDVDAIKELIDFFGAEQIKNNCLLVLTRSENKPASAKTNLRDDLRDREDLQELNRVFGLGISFMGAIDADAVETLGEVIEEPMARRVAEMKDALLDLLLAERDEVPVPELKSAKKAQQQEIQRLINSTREKEKERKKEMGEGPGPKAQSEEGTCLVM